MATATATIGATRRGRGSPTGSGGGPACSRTSDIGAPQAGHPDQVGVVGGIGGTAGSRRRTARAPRPGSVGRRRPRPGNAASTVPTATSEPPIHSHRLSGMRRTPKVTVGSSAVAGLTSVR